MNANKNCPTCGARFHLKNHYSYGWYKATRPKLLIKDHRCNFIANNMRCPLPGTISPSKKAASTWYCRRHSRTMGNTVSGEKELHYINNNHEKIIREEYIDWRRDLFNLNPKKYRNN